MTLTPYALSELCVINTRIPISRAHYMCQYRKLCSCCCVLCVYLFLVSFLVDDGYVSIYTDSLFVSHSTLVMCCPYMIRASPTLASHNLTRTPMYYQVGKF
jgi:hypothetical protein